MASSTKGKAVFLDFVERAGWSAGQVFFATLLAGGASIGVAGLPWKTAGALALGAAVSSAILTAVQYLGRFTNLSFWPDLLVRLAKTFLGSLGGSIAASKVFDVTTFHWSAALNIAALATLSALGKGLLARGEAVIPAIVGEPGSTQDASGEVATGRAAPVAVGRVPAQTVRTMSTPSTLPTSTYLNAIGR